MSTPQQLNLNPTEEGLVTSGITLGAAFGALLVGKLADMYGRKRTLTYLAVVFFFGTLFCSLAPNAILMIICRFLLGFAVGGASVVVPTYLAEISITSLRGRMVTHNELMITGGQCLAFIVNAILGTCFPHVGSIWRYMIGFGMIPAILLFIGVRFVPESPRWLVMKGHQDSAMNVLLKIRGSRQQAAEEVQSVKDTADRHQSIQKAKLRDLFQPRVRKLILTGIGLGIMMQFVGINIMMYYGTTILMHAGFGHQAALVANIGNGLTSFIATIFGMHLMGSVDRRKMLLIGITGSGTSMLLITLVALFLSHSPALPYITICLTMCFLAFFQSCVSPTTWVLMSEIFPQGLRGIGMGISTFANWLANFFVGFIFPIMISHWGTALAFATFVGCNVLSWLFAFFCVPETRGKSLEKIQDELLS